MDFTMKVADPLQALMAGKMGYDMGAGMAEQGRKAAFRSGLEQLMSGGQQPSMNDAAMLALRHGDMNSAATLANMALAQANQQYMQQRDARDFGFRQQEAQRAGQQFQQTHGLQERALSQKDETATPEGRARIAAKNGLSPTDPAYKSYVLTGRMPREDQAPLTATDKKAILDADEAVMTNKAVIDQLEQAKKLSTEAYAGIGAAARTYVGNNLPDWLVPDVIASPGRSEKSANYENIVLGQALQQLKGIFGSAPTEGERKILLDLQASVSQPDVVRQEILGRATALAQNRLKFNEQRAQELRGGTYYKSQGSTPTQKQQPAQQINEGQRAHNPATGQTIVFRGGQWQPE